MLMTHAASLLFPGRRTPEEIWEIGAENFAWIDFFWSTMGRSGRIGPEVQKVYISLGYDRARDELIENLVRAWSTNTTPSARTPHGLRASPGSPENWWTRLSIRREKRYPIIRRARMRDPVYSVIWKDRFEIR